MLTFANVVKSQSAPAVLVPQKQQLPEHIFVLPHATNAFPFVSPFKAVSSA
jgi:hypothetical protein